MKTETGLPTERGYYVVFQPLCDRPIVLWWNNAGEWRSGCVKVVVEAWIGPLPKWSKQ